MMDYFYSPTENKRYSFDYLKRQKGFSSKQDAIVAGYVEVEKATMVPPTPTSLYVSPVEDGVSVENGIAKVKWRFEKKPANLIRDIFLAKFEQKLESYFDTIAKAKGYDDKKSCMLRVAYDGPYNNEAKQFAQWVDKCYSRFFSIPEDESLGSNLPETWADVVKLLPVLPWSI